MVNDRSKQTSSADPSEFSVRLYRREWVAFSEYCKVMGYGAPAEVCEKAIQSYLVSGEFVKERASPEEFTKRSKEYWVLYCRMYGLLGMSVLIAFIATLSMHVSAGEATFLLGAAEVLLLLSASLAGAGYAIAEMLHGNRTGGHSKGIVKLFRRLEVLWLWAWSFLLISVALSLLGLAVSTL